MNVMRGPVLWLAAALCAVVVPLYAQSLADVAREEQARRQGVVERTGRDSRVYTNKDLNGDAPRPRASSRAASRAPSRVPSTAGARQGAGNTTVDVAASDSPSRDVALDVEPATTATDTATATRDDERAAEAAAPVERGENAWRRRMTTLGAKVERDKVLAEALEGYVSALTRDAVNRDDPAQKALIEADRTRALEELRRTRQAIDEGIGAIESLEEEARRAGVPPGWLR
jgi:hypothetical protein